MFVLNSGEIAEMLVFVGEPSVVVVEIRFPTQELYHRAVDIANAQWGTGAQKKESPHDGTDRSQNN
jgi:hypothetical protein